MRNEAGHGLLVGQMQRLVAREERGALEAVQRAVGDGLDERDGIADRADHPAVFVRERRVLHEIQVPVLGMTKIGESTLGKRADEVEGHRGARIGFEHALRIRLAGLGREGGAVDNVAAVGRQRLTIPRLDVRRARLRELTRKASDPKDASFQSEDEHETHLQQDLQAVRDEVRSAVLEPFGTVAAL